MKKKLIVTMAMVMIMSVVLGSGVFAGTSTVSGSCGGFSCQGRISCDLDSGSATTIFSGPSTGLSVRLQYTYTNVYGESFTIDKYKSQDATSVSLSRSCPSGAYASTGAYGEFTVEYGADYWFGRKSEDPF